MKINGEEVLEFTVRGENQGDLGVSFKTLPEVYDFIKQLKKDDRRFHYTDEIYSVEVVTPTSVYGDYTIKKYKNKYWLQ